MERDVIEIIEERKRRGEGRERRGRSGEDRGTLSRALCVSSQQEFCNLLTKSLSLQ